MDPRGSASVAAAAPDLRAKVGFLGSPEAYPGRPAGVDAIQTHMSWVFLAGPRAYKLKKPVCYRHVDFSTLERRRASCEDELRLNRRLAPDVYLGTLPLTVDDHGGLALGGAGEVVDWLVVMRRLRAELMLDRRLAAGTVGDGELTRVAHRLARFYTSLPAEPLSPAAYRGRLAAAVAADREALLRPLYRLPAPVVEALARAQLEFVRTRAQMLGARVDAGRVCEGHGDLRPEHVCLEPEPVIIDCLEFDRELRVVDALSDVAFLALECRRLGATWAGKRLLEVYAEAAGDPAPAALVRFYQARHAFARAKIAAWHLDDEVVVHPERSRAKALAYLDLAC